MLVTVSLLGLLAIATYTDLRWGKIFNSLTYSGILLGLAANAVATLLHIDARRGPAIDFERYGLVGIESSLLGLFCCGCLMLVCFVFFPGQVGGGDVKLIAMLGAILGLERGLEAMLWTFIFGGCFGLVVLIWRYGAVRLLSRIGKYLYLTAKTRGPVSLTAEQREPLRRALFLAPAAAVAVIVVQWNLAGWLSL